MLFFGEATWDAHPFHIVSLLNENDAGPSNFIACAYVMSILLDSQVDRLYRNKKTTYRATRKFNTAQTRKHVPHTSQHMMLSCRKFMFPSVEI